VQWENNNINLNVIPSFFDYDMLYKECPLLLLDYFAIFAVLMN